MHKRSCNLSVVRAEPPEDLGAVHPREKGTDMKLWDGMASSSHRRWLVWLDHREAWVEYEVLDRKRVSSKGKDGKVEGRGGQWWDLTQGLENSLWQLLEHLFGVRREWGRLLRGLLQRSRGELVAWTRVWWRNVEKYIYDAELCVYLYVWWVCIVLIQHRPDSIIGWEGKK